ncbi:MAG: DUF3617 domain-containing protein [Rhodoferax sp.]|nr:DUF3617 domain-containing protein [Rhodoferax sp.]
MKPLLLAAGSILILCGAAGSAAQTLKPGLWEISQKMQSASGEMENAMADMQKQMAAMSPEQRKMMQDTMAKQGVSIGAAGPGPITIKVCMTKDMVERNEVAIQEGDCKATNTPRVGNTMKISFVCTQPPTSGEGQMTFSSPEAYASKMTVKSARNGKNESMTMDMQGKWLSAECGAIKPPPLAKK